MHWIGYPIIIVAALIIARIIVHRVVVQEHLRGVLYSHGKYVRTLQPGPHWYCPIVSTITYVDTRQRFSTVSGQEVLSKDGLSLKTSLSVVYEVSDPYLAISVVQDYEQAVYLLIQVALREIIGNTDIDDLLSKRDEIGKNLTEVASGKVALIGINLVEVEIKDIMFPGPLKRVFAMEVEARKEAQAALEKARGEASAMRSLANTARLLDKNPNLMLLRLLQVLGEKSGNTVVLGVPASPGMQVIEAAAGSGAVMPEAGEPG